MTSTQAKIFKENNPNLRVDFSPIKFNAKIQEKGLNVQWEKTIVCPCRKDLTSQAVVDCVNCGGTGWYFFDPIEIKALISGASFQKNYFMWSEVLQGSVMISVDPIYKLGWYDNITVLDAYTIYSETIPIKIIDENTGILTLTTRYPVNSITSAFTFLGPDASLNQISLDNVSINKRVVTITDSTLREGETVALLYDYHPSYLVVDMLNDYRNTYVKNKRPEEQLELMPIKVLAKKLHLVLT